MIRPFSNSDKTQLIELLRLNTPEYFAPEEEADFLDYLERELEDYFVLEENGVILGCGGINYLNGGKEARISWDMIHPGHHGKGLGRVLTQYRLDRIRENPAVEVIVVRTSQLAASFYSRMGFDLVRTEPDYWAPGLDLYYMEIPLR